MGKFTATRLINTLEVTPDTSDSFGFRFVSNQNGVIFTAEPIR